MVEQTSGVGGHQFAGVSGAASGRTQVMRLQVAAQAPPCTPLMSGGRGCLRRAGLSAGDGVERFDADGAHYRGEGGGHP